MSEEKEIIKKESPKEIELEEIKLILESLKNKIENLKQLEISKTSLEELNKIENAEGEYYIKIGPGVWIFKHPKDCRDELEFKLKPILAKEIILNIIQDDKIRELEKKNQEQEEPSLIKDFLIGKATPDDIITIVLSQKIRDKEIPIEEALKIISHDLLKEVWVIYNLSKEI